MKQIYVTRISLMGLLLLSSILASAQAVTVTGKVKNETEMEMPGVNVIVKGTTIGTTTDASGNYTIGNVPSNGTLVFSFIGYKTTEVSVTNRSTIDVALATDVASLNEVVVVGYGTSSKKDVINSIVKIDPKTISTAANANVGDLLFGRAAGLQASQQSAQPGGLVNLSIRGRTGTPLFVVDGIVMPNSALEPGINFAEINNVSRGGLAGINPNDIESIEVLKDGAAAIYGVAAGNGVILITTKKGKAGSLNINYSGSVSVQKNFNYLQPLNATEYMKNFNRLQQDQYLANNNMAPFGPTAATGVPVTYSEAQIANPQYNTNWANHVLRTGQVTNHTLALSGGTDRVTYYFSGNYFNQVGTVQNSGLQKFNGKMDLSLKINKVITLNTGLIASRNNYANTVAGWQTGGAGSNAYTALQAALAYSPLLPTVDPATGKYSQFLTIGNPIAQLGTRDKTQYGSFYGTTSMDITVLPNVLTGKVLYGNNMESSSRDFFIPSTTNWFDAYQSRGSLQWAKRQTQTMESYLTFKKKFGSVDVNVVGGTGQYIYDDFSFGVQTTGMLDGINTTNVSGAPSQANSSKNRNVKRSYFARGTVDLSNRYVITASIRRDGYSQFFPDSKYQNFPSVSFGWKISNESFFGSSSVVDLLKLRASTGTLGTLLPNGLAYAQFSPDADVVSFDGGATHYTPFVQTQLNQPNLTWARTINKTVGLDFGFFNNRISGSLDWFRDDATDLLNQTANTPALSQIATQPVNGGHQVRKGYEVALNASPVRGDKFNWNTIVNLSHYTFKWDGRFKEDDLANYQHVKDPVNAIYAWETKGILQLGQTAPAWQPAGAMKAGSPIYVDRNGDNKLDSADVKVYDQTPKISLGIGNVFKYGNFDFTIFLYGQYGAYKRNNSLSWADAYNMVSTGTNASRDISHVWTSENPGGTLPGAMYRDDLVIGNVGNLIGSDYTIKKADFIRARNITLGYTVSAPSITKYVKSLRVYVDVQNAFVITKFQGADPEVTAPAVKGAAAPYPMVRTFSLGVNANF